MFTGIIESLGKITDLKVDRGNIDFTIESDISKELKVDQSVSHNGVCLTVTETNNNTHTVTAVKETLDKSSLTNFSVNDLINLERAMKLGERLDGHLVQGHVDGVAKCLGVSVNDGSWIYKFEFDDLLTLLLYSKYGNEYYYIPQVMIYDKKTNSEIKKFFCNLFVITINDYRFLGNIFFSTSNKIGSS